jgi:hypothetical protein
MRHYDRAMDTPLEMTGCNEAICSPRVTLTRSDGSGGLLISHCTTCHVWDSHVACSNCGACITGKEFQRHAKPSYADAIAAFFGGGRKGPEPRYCSLRCCRAVDKAEREAAVEREREWDAKAKENRAAAKAERDRRIAMRAALREAPPASVRVPISVTELRERVAAARDVHDPSRALWWVDWLGEDIPEGETCGRCSGIDRYYYRSLCLKHAWAEAEHHLANCEVCGREFVQRTRWFGGSEWSPEREGVARYCDDVCRGVADSERTRSVRAESRNGLTCEVCGEVLDVARKDARYCSPACRQKAYRARRSS